MRLAAHYVSGDINGNGRLDQAETWTYQATATVAAGEQCTTATATAPGSAVTPTDAGCYTGVDPQPPIAQTIAVARWIEGTPAALTVGTGPVFAAGRSLRFTYWVSDPGPASLSDVTLVDDRGTPADTSDDLVPVYVSGDTDGNGLLGPGETWTYTAIATPLSSAVCSAATATGAAGAASITSSALACYTGQAPDPTDLTQIFGNTDLDQIEFDQTYLGAKTRVYGGPAETAGPGPDGTDQFTVFELQTMDVAAGHTLTLDGQQGSDGYQVITTGSQGDPRNYVVNVLDTGTTGIDVLTVIGSGGDDIFLLRKTTSIRDIAPVGWPAGVPWVPIGSNGSAFIALLRTTLGDAATSDPDADPSVRPQEVQRVNYDLGVDDPGSGAFVLGLGGDDTFGVDGTSADVVLDGGDGNDTFQIGQVYGSKRDILQTGGSLEPEDLFPAGYQTVPTVRGWMSRGNSLPLIATAARATTRSRSMPIPRR